MTLSILFIGVVATVAFARDALARVNDVQGYAVKFRFIFEKGSQLIKRQITKSGALSLSNRDALSHALQIFDGERAIRAFSIQHQTFRDAVVFRCVGNGIACPPIV